LYVSRTLLDLHIRMWLQSLLKRSAYLTQGSAVSHDPRSPVVTGLSTIDSTAVEIATPLPSNSAPSLSQSPGPALGVRCLARSGDRWSDRRCSRSPMESARHQSATSRHSPQSRLTRPRAGW